MRVNEIDRERADRGLSISQLALMTEISRFAASRHLSILRSAGLVVAEQVSNRTLHRLSMERFEALEETTSVVMPKPTIDGGRYRRGPAR